MQWWMLGIGVALIVVTLIDVVLTVVALASRAGPLTSRVTSWLWTLAAPLRRRRRQRLLALLGMSSIIVVVAVWLVLLWIGWTCVLTADPSAVRDTATGRPAGFGDRVYFAGYSVFTLGNGDFRPDGWPWQVATVLASASGLAVVTLAITYIFGIVTAVTTKRQVALVIWSLGRDPHEVVTRSWDGSHLGNLDQRLWSVVPVLARLAEQHLAYPMLHQFHSIDRRSAIAPNVALLNEALMVLQSGVRGWHGVEAATIAALHEVIDAYLATLSVVGAPHHPPEPTDLSPVADVGLPTVHAREFLAATNAVADRRGRLLAAVLETGWDWSDVDQR